MTAAHPASAGPADAAARTALAGRPVFLAMAVLAIVLTAASNGYGYHRDELYFRMLEPAWGYVDQPPLTPFLARLTLHIADEPWALRLPATFCAVAAVYVVAAIAREVGGGRSAQTLAAWAYLTASFPLVFGHILLTASIDLLVWPLLGLWGIRALLRDPRWWLGVGLVVGLSTYNKLLIGLLIGSLVVGLLVVGPRRGLGARWLAGGVAAAAVIAAPNLIYQATHDWPQLTMGAALAANNADEVRVLMWPFLLLLLGPPLVPIWVAGVVTVFRSPDRRRIRSFAAALPVLLILTFLSGAQFYYPLGLVTVLYAIGCVPAAEWMAGRIRRFRWSMVAFGVNAVVSALIALPLIPLPVVGDTPIPGINQAARDTIGWPTYVDQVAAVVATARTGSDAEVAVITGNYGEAGAIARYGPAVGIDTVYSGHNALGLDTPPRESMTTVVFVGAVYGVVSAYFGRCVVQAELDNGRGVDNEEQGVPVAICTGRTASWITLWPLLRHLD